MSPTEYRTERERRCFTQAALAARLDLDPQTISRRERGEIPITPEAAMALLSIPKIRRLRIVEPSQPSNPHNSAQLGATKHGQHSA